MIGAANFLKVTEMSIIIQNVSDERAAKYGVNNYIVRINKKVICEFTHDRRINGLAQCLRDAADAVVAENEKNKIALLNAIL